MGLSGDFLDIWLGVCVCLCPFLFCLFVSGTCGVKDGSMNRACDPVRVCTGSLPLS